MARRKAKMTVGAKYTAVGALTEILRGMLDNDDDFVTETPERIAERLVDQAYDVEHFPVAGKVQLTLDLSRLDQPAEPEGGTPV